MTGLDYFLYGGIVVFVIYIGMMAIRMRNIR